MWKIGNMLWRIGDVLEIDEQIAWTKNAGFDGIGLHASSGSPPNWRGVEPSECTGECRAALREQVEELAYAEIHAPFAIELKSGELASGLAALRPVLSFAKDIGAGIVTVHADIPGAPTDDEAASWRDAMGILNDDAEAADVLVGLEIMDGFDAVLAWNLPRVGLTLDVGHMYLPAQTHVLERHGSIGSLVRHIGGKLFHLHMHDVNGDVDHIEVGTGCVDIDDLLAVLKDAGYQRAMTLELNPSRVSPDGIRRSMESMREKFPA